MSKGPLAQLVAKDNTVFIPSHRNDEYIKIFLEDSISQSLDQLITKHFVGFRQKYPNTWTIIVEVSTEQLAKVGNFSVLHWAVSKVKDLFDAYVTSIKYDFKQNVDVSPIPYHQGDGKYTYFIFRFEPEHEDLYNHPHASKYETFSYYFGKLVDEAIDSVVTNKERYSLLHVPLVHHDALLRELQVKIDHHNQFVCKIKPMRKKVKFALEHHEDGINASDLGSIMVMITCQ